MFNEKKNSIILNHSLSNATICFGGEKDVSLRNKKSICCGDSSNSINISLHSHCGTHTDFPFHFFSHGKKLTDYHPNDFFFFNPFTINVSIKNISYIITLEDIQEEIPENCDFLILKTGFEKYRGTEYYWQNGPGISPDLGAWLRKSRPNLRAIGFDFISLTSYNKRDIGREAHRVFLNPATEGTPIWIIEDMRLSELNSPLESVIIAPLYIQDADGAPTTVFGIIK